MASTPYLKKRGCPKAEARGAVVGVISAIDSKGLYHRFPTLKDRDGVDMLKSRRSLTTGETGSSTFTWQITTYDDEKLVCKIASKYKIVDDQYVKLEDAKYERVLVGQEHEKKIYALMSDLVQDQVTPFVLQSINIKSYRNSICTETNASAMTLSKYIRTKLPSISQFKKIFFSILYTLECFFRIGVRHGDLHPGNILMFPVEKSKEPVIFEYITRNYESFRYDVSGMRDIPIVYDFDRSFKFSRYKVTSKYSKELSSLPVTSRWPHYNPELDTSHLNAFKLFSHLHVEVTKSNLQAHVQLLSKLILTKEQRNHLEHIHNFRERLWRRYHIPSVKDGVEISIKHMVPNVESVLMSLLPTVEGRRGPAHFSMKRMYMPSSIS